MVRMAAAHVIQFGCFGARKNGRRTLDLHATRVVRLAGGRELLDAPPTVLEHQPGRIRVPEVEQAAELLRLLALDPELPDHLRRLDRVPGALDRGGVQAHGLGRQCGERAQQQPRVGRARGDAVAGDARGRVPQRGLGDEDAREVAVRPRGLVAGARTEDDVRRVRGAQAARGRAVLLVRARGGRGRGLAAHRARHRGRVQAGGARGRDSRPGCSGVGARALYGCIRGRTDCPASSQHRDKTRK
jgi:hypothetical protein